MSETQASWSLCLPAAVSGQECGGLAVDAGVAAHLGDPLREQRRWVAGQALVDQGHHAVLQVAGEQRLAWLQGLLTQQVEDLAPGQAIQSLLLSPHGHVEHHVRLVDNGQLTWLLSQPESGPSLLEFLQSMVFRSRVQVSLVSDRFLVVALCPGELLSRLEGQFPQATVLRLQHRPDAQQPFAQWVEVVLPREHLAAGVGFTAEEVAGLWAFEAWRVEQGLPRLGVDSDKRSLPHELGWIDSAVALGKGCYRGQETVARVHNLGRPPRRLVRLHLDGSVERLPSPAAPVLAADGQVVGFVGTSARHFELGPVALAVVKRGVDPAASLTVEQIPASQEQIVPADAGPAVEVPRLGSLAARGLTGIRKPGGQGQAGRVG